MKKLIPADTVDSEEENTNNLIPEDTVYAAEENTNNLIPSDTVYAAGNVGENTNNLIPADTVDAAGNVWKTVGENIRNGIKNFSKSNIEAIIDAIFPVGSIYIGESKVVTSVGQWKLINIGDTRPIIMFSPIKCGTLMATPFVVDEQEKKAVAVTIRLWERVA